MRKKIFALKNLISGIYGLILSALILIAAIWVTGCGGSRQFVPPPPLPDDRRHIPEPEFRKYNYVADAFDKQFTDQLEQSMDLSRQFRHLFGKPKPAYNVDAFDEVPNSSWFTNRNASQKMILEDIAGGPNTSSGPDTTGTWQVTRAKAEGVTPGFSIKDKHGDRYVIKFDPKGYSELATGAEVVSTKLFYAAGYYTPENHITYFHPRILEVGEKVKFTDSHGKKRYMTQADTKELLDKVETLPDGRVRAMASKYIPGKPMGPFAYEGYRKDDPNDFIPHQHRRELRGLRVMAAWLNHTDTKSGNSFDSYVTEDGKSYIRHYLIDFGSTLGSAAHGPYTSRVGQVNQIDPHDITQNILTLGLNVKSYEKKTDFEYTSIGFYESSMFDPWHFKFNTPNPAFENCFNLDGFWGAKLVMSFTDEQLETAVAQGQYSDPEAAAYLLKTLKERRDTTGRYWFNKVNPLDNFRIETIDDQPWLCFDDLMVETGLEEEGNSRYRYSTLNNEYQDLGNETCLNLRGLFFHQHASSYRYKMQYTIKIQKYGKQNNKCVNVFLEYTGPGSPEIIGIERE